MTTQPQLRAVVAARVSHMTGPQKTSHITQHGTGDTHAQTRGWSVVGHVEDLDVSAIKVGPWDRPDLRTWLVDRVGEFDALIFAKTDRVFRRADDSFEMTKWCQEHRKILVLVDDGITLDFHTPESEQDPMSAMFARIFLFMASFFAEMEGRRFVQRSQDRERFLRRTDRWAHGAPTYGHTVVDHPAGEGKALDLDPDTQPVLHWIANKIIQGESLTGVITRLGNMPILSPRDYLRTRNNKLAKGYRWSTGTVADMLTRPSTQGIKMTGGRAVLDANGEPIRVGPASFDDETWRQLQIAVSLRRQAQRQRVYSGNPQLGVGKCGLCGSNLRQQGYTKYGREFRYYRCARNPKPCPGVSVVADEFDRLIQTQFLRAYGDHRIKVRVWHPGSDHSYELARVEETLQVLMEDRAQGMYNSAAAQDTYRRQVQSLEARQATLAAEPVTQPGWVEEETPETYREVWAAAGAERKRKLLIDSGVKYYLTVGGVVTSPDLPDLGTPAPTPINAKNPLPGSG